MFPRILKVSGIALSGIFLLLLVFPYVFPGLVAEQVKKWVNRHISGEMNYTTARLSFFRHFPSLTLTLEEFSLKGSGC
jgi:AsmA protein